VVPARTVEAAHNGLTMDQASIPVSDPNSLLRTLLASSGDCIKILDLDGNLIFMTEGGQRIMEVADFSAIKGCPWPDFWQDKGNLDAKAAIKAALRGEIGHFQGFATTMAGTPKWWDVTVMLIRDADGRPEKLLSVSRDITASHQAEQHLKASEARFRTFAQAMPNQVWSATPDGQLDWFNDQVFAYSGLTFDDLAGSKWSRMVNPDDIGAAAATWAKALSEGIAYQTEFRLRREDGSFRWHLARALPIKDKTSEITRWIGTNTDIDDYKAIAAELEESRQRVTVAINAADIGTWDLDPRSGVLKWDRRCYELFGLTPGKPISFEIFLAGLHPLDREAVEKACLDAMKVDGTQAYDIEYRTVGLDDGIERWCSAKGKAHFDNGVAVRFIGTIRDISKLKKAEAQQELLTRELEHRMKNTMAMISAIASQTFRTASTKEEAQTIFDARLRAFNNAHDELVKSSWTTAPMTTVVEGALAPHRSGEGRIRIEGAAVILTAKQALSLAIALHELATNATKYGALSVPGGTIDVTWTCNLCDETPVLCFCWRESGGPQVAPPARRGFGSRLIESTLSSDFGGAAKIEYAPEGLICKFETKMSDLD
jgi:PAS domain S-box-containing protein